MLRPNFLGTLSDYVSVMIDSQPGLLDEKASQFGLPGLVDKNPSEGEKMISLFSEWLVFDHKQKIFDQLSGIEYFVKHNPLKLSESDMNAYKEMLDYKVGYFEVKNIEIGRGLLLESIPENIRYFTNDVTASMSAKINDTVWARIAPVGGIYHMVGSLFFIVPFKFLSGMQDAMRGWDKNSINAKEIAEWLAGSNGDKQQKNMESRLDSIKDFEKELENCRKSFIESLRKCKMDTIFSLKTFEKWVTNEKNFGAEFTGRALICLVPTGLSEKNFESLYTSAMHLMNALPRKEFEGKSPNQRSHEVPESERLYDMNIYSKDKYMDIVTQAHGFMQDYDYKSSYKEFERAIRALIEDKVPLFDSFRIYANAAVSAMANDDYGLGEELLHAALRVNPKYEFAKRTLEREVEPYKDLSTARRGYAKSLIAITKDDGIRRYKRTPFRKYEDWLKKIGVSLDYETTTQITTYNKSSNQPKIGRNDPCYCDSKKKFKKCHGS